MAHMSYSFHVFSMHILYMFYGLPLLTTFSGLKIVVTHLPYPRQYRVNDITTKTASEQT